MKYSELDAYLELARWENERDDYHIKVYRNGYTVAEVGLWEQYNIKILDPIQMTEGLYRRITELANTPLTERKDEKRYWLRKILIPLLGEESERYFCKPLLPNYQPCVDGDRRQDSKFQTIFTESEIEDMDITGFEKEEVTP